MSITAVREGIPRSMGDAHCMWVKQNSTKDATAMERTASGLLHSMSYKMYSRYAKWMQDAYSMASDAEYKHRIEESLARLAEEEKRIPRMEVDKEDEYPALGYMDWVNGTVLTSMATALKNVREIQLRK